MASRRTGSSSSSYNSSSRGPASYLAQQASPVDSTFTPISAVSSSESSAPLTPLVPLDLGPPGYHASIKLFEQMANELTVYLGPWEISTTNPRRVIWQCSYEGEVLEHFLPSNNPAAIFPYTLHAQHRRFGDPRENELYISFREPHRIRYTTISGLVYDEYIDVKYDFTTIEGSMQFQGDVRGRDLIDWFDVDVVWSDTHRRTDPYGNVRGLGTIQRMKLWRDRYSTIHYISFFANHRRRWKEYLVHNFDEEPRDRDDRHRRLQLSVRGASRRGSATENNSSRDRRFSASSIFRPRQASVASGPQSSAASSSSSSSQSQLDIRYLGIQFTRNERAQQGSEDYRRFMDQWTIAHNADNEFEVSFPTNHVELESPQITGMAGPSWGLPPVREPPDDGDSEGTP